jgi:hypothetical protein
MQIKMLEKNNPKIFWSGIEKKNPGINPGINPRINPWD